MAQALRDRCDRARPKRNAPPSGGGSQLTSWAHPCDARIILSTLLRDDAGNISILYALMIRSYSAQPNCVDYSRGVGKARYRRWLTPLQSRGRELLANDRKIAAIARNYVTTQINYAVVGTKVTRGPTVRVDLKGHRAYHREGDMAGENSSHGQCHANRRRTAAVPRGLDTKAAGTIKLEQYALLTAPGCVVYSDSEPARSSRWMTPCSSRVHLLRGRQVRRKTPTIRRRRKRTASHFGSACRRKAPRPRAATTEPCGRRHDHDTQAGRLLRRPHHLNGAQ